MTATTTSPSDTTAAPSSATTPTPQRPVDTTEDRRGHVPPVPLKREDARRSMLTSNDADCTPPVQLKREDARRSILISSDVDSAPQVKSEDAGRSILTSKDADCAPPAHLKREEARRSILISNDLNCAPPAQLNREDSIRNMKGTDKDANHEEMPPLPNVEYQFWTSPSAYAIYGIFLAACATHKLWLLKGILLVVLYKIVRILFLWYMHVVEDPEVTSAFRFFREWTERFMKEGEALVNDGRNGGGAGNKVRLFAVSLGATKGLEPVKMFLNHRMENINALQKEGVLKQLDVYHKRRESEGKSE